MKTASAAVDGMTKEHLVSVYRMLRMIRSFEERVHDEYADGNVPGATHLYAGEEAVAVGVCVELRPDDYVAGTHRGHGHAIAKGADITGVILEIFGKSGGVCKGKGGSMHIADFAHGMLGANGIAGGGAPLACGAALSAKVRKTDQVAVAFVGDGGANQGAFPESLSLAAVWQLPVVFVVEDNGYAQYTGSSYHLRGLDVARRGEAFGMPGVVVDGCDFFAVREAAAEAVHRARSGDGPSVIDCKTVRFFGHMEGYDQQAYRGPGETARLRAERDCIRSFTERVVTAGLVTRAEFDAIDREITIQIAHAAEVARAAPMPEPEELLTDVYVSY
jgi:acetoin:2,6-dichlorophenolindophenol oxidoreductase subunit alpha